MSAIEKITTRRTVPKDEQVDVRGGRCTYGQMIELGRVLEKAGMSADTGEVATIRALISALHPNVEAAINVTNVMYASNISQGVRFWREREADRLRYEPTAEEKMAGYEALSRAIGPAGVASTIAEKFGVSGGPDEVFKWPYASVFMVLLIDLERFKFQKRLQDIRDNKRKREDRARRMGKK